MNTNWMPRSGVGSALKGCECLRPGIRSTLTDALGSAFRRSSGPRRHGGPRPGFRHPPRLPPRLLISLTDTRAVACSTRAAVFAIDKSAQRHVRQRHADRSRTDPTTAPGLTLGNPSGPRLVFRLARFQPGPPAAPRPDRTRHPPAAAASSPPRPPSPQTPADLAPTAFPPDRHGRMTDVVRNFLPQRPPPPPPPGLDDYSAGRRYQRNRGRRPTRYPTTMPS